MGLCDRIVENEKEPQLWFFWGCLGNTPPPPREDPDPLWGEVRPAPLTWRFFLELCFIVFGAGDPPPPAGPPPCPAHRHRPGGTSASWSTTSPPSSPRRAGSTVAPSPPSTAPCSSCGQRRPRGSARCPCPAGCCIPPLFCRAALSKQKNRVWRRQMHVCMSWMLAYVAQKLRVGGSRPVRHFECSWSLALRWPCWKANHRTAPADLPVCLRYIFVVICDCWFKVSAPNFCFFNF